MLNVNVDERQMASMELTSDVAALLDALPIDEPVTLEAAMQRGREFLARASRRSAKQLQTGSHLPKF